MPRRVTAYACIYKCKRKVTTHRQDMVQHEERCKLNPVRRACPTCEHEEPNEICDGGGWFCVEDHLPEEAQIMYDCPHHILRKDIYEA